MSEVDETTITQAVLDRLTSCPSPRLRQISEALVRHPGHVKSRKQLTKEGYPNDTYVSDRTIDTHIKRLRRKFEEADPSFAAIETVYGVGYRWVT